MKIYFLAILVLLIGIVTADSGSGHEEEDPVSLKRVKHVTELIVEGADDAFKDIKLILAGRFKLHQVAAEINGYLPEFDGHITNLLESSGRLFYAIMSQGLEDSPVCEVDIYIDWEDMGTSYDEKKEMLKDALKNNMRCVMKYLKGIRHVAANLNQKVKSGLPAHIVLRDFMDMMIISRHIRHTMDTVKMAIDDMKYYHPVTKRTSPTNPTTPTPPTKSTKRMPPTRPETTPLSESIESANLAHSGGIKKLRMSKGYTTRQPSHIRMRGLDDEITSLMNEVNNS